ncbi:hypothetical protein Tco_0532089 [Tanacetum coccineum]
MRSMRLLLSLSSCDLCLCLRCRLVPSCFVIFDLEPLSLSFDFIEHEHVVMNPTSAGMRHHHLHLYIQRISLTGFPAQSVGSSNTYVLDLPCLLVLITGTSQSRQHVDTSLIHIESRKSPTAVLFDDDTGRISIRHFDDTKVSIPNVERPWLSKTEGFNFPNHDTVADYDSAEESSLICKTPLPPLEKLAGAERVSGPKTIKSILKSCSTIKTDTLKGVIINEPTNSSALAKGNKNVSISKKGSASASKLKNVKTKDDIPLSIVMKELNDQKLQISKNQSAYSKNNKPQHVPQNSL